MIMIIIYMSRGSDLAQNAIDGVFLPRSPIPSRFWGSDLVLQCRTCYIQMLYLRCQPRPRGVPTSFYNLIVMFLTNRVRHSTSLHFTK